MRKTYRGERIEVTFDRGLCIHVAECLLRLPEVFALRKRPWIAPDEASPDAVAATVEKCPSGALEYRRLDGGAQEQTAEPATVTPMRNGPLLLRGRFEIRDADGTRRTLPRASLCRCGLSASKPFCDNTHLKERFRAEGEQFRVELSPVRPALEQPMTREEDPRA